jgi:uncharacterized protein YkwD
MTPIGAPKTGRMLLVTVAGLLLTGCGAGEAAIQAADAPVPTSVSLPGWPTPPPPAGDVAAHPATAAPRTSTPSASGTRHPRSTGHRTSEHRSNRTTARAPARPPRTSPSPTRRATPRPTSKPTTRPTTQPTTQPAPSTPPSTSGLTAAEAEVLTLVNKERAAAGCGPLTSNSILVSVARAHSTDMAVHRYFDHNSQDGRSPFDRMRAAGYQGRLMGENIAAGQPTPTAVMDAWMHSPGHRANILNCGFKAVGIGVATLAGSPYRIYWTQDFGDR